MAAAKTHSLIEGYATSSCQGIGPLPSLWVATIPPSIPSCTPLVTTPPVPTHSDGCRCLPIACQRSRTQLLPTVSPLSQNSCALPTAPTCLTHAIAGAEGRDLGFPAMAGRSSIPVVQPSPARNLSYGDREESSCALNTRILHPIPVGVVSVFTLSRFIIR